MERIGRDEGVEHGFALHVGMDADRPHLLNGVTAVRRAPGDVGWRAYGFVYYRATLYQVAFWGPTCHNARHGAPRGPITKGVNTSGFFVSVSRPYACVGRHDGALRAGN